MKEEGVIERIEDWLDDLLSEKEAADMQARVEADPSLRAMVDMVKERRKVVEGFQADHYRNKISEWKKAPAPAASGKWIRIWLIVLGAMLGSFILYRIFIPETVPSLPVPTTQPIANKPPNTSTTQIVDNQQPDPTNEQSDSPPVTPDRKIPQTHKKPIKKTVLHFSADNKFTIEITIAPLADSALVESNLYLAIEGVPNYDYLLDVREIARGGGRVGSAFTHAIKVLEKNMDSTIVLLAGIQATDNDYADAQRLLAFLYLRKVQYHNAAFCYKNYDDMQDTPDSNWMLLGFYLKDYTNSKEKALALLQEIIADSTHKYAKQAREVSRLLKR